MPFYRSRRSSYNVRLFPKESCFTTAQAFRFPSVGVSGGRAHVEHDASLHVRYSVTSRYAWQHRCSPAIRVIELELHVV